MYLSFLASIIIYENGEILKSYLELGAWTRFINVYLNLKKRLSFKI